MLGFLCFVFFLFVSTSATDCLERLVSAEMACYVLSGVLNSTLLIRSLKPKFHYADFPVTSATNP